MVAAKSFVSVQSIRQTLGRDHLILGHTGGVTVVSCSSHFSYSSGLLPYWLLRFCSVVLAHLAAETTFFFPFYSL